MKQLRKTIRKILLENNEHYDKLAKMIVTGQVDLIHQAIELAETLEYITNVSYEEMPYFLGKNKTEHRWEFDADQGLSDAIKAERGLYKHHNPNFGARFDHPTAGHTILRQIADK